MKPSDRGAYEDAVTLLVRAIEIDSGFVVANYVLGGHDHDGPGLALRAGHAGRETEEQTHEHQRREPNPTCTHRRASLSVFRAM